MYVEGDVGKVGDLWIVRPDGREKKLLVRTATQPAWSADGTEVVLARLKGSVSSLGITDLQGHQRELFPASRR